MYAFVFFGTMALIVATTIAFIVESYESSPDDVLYDDEL
jgi:hypothetical protein